MEISFWFAFSSDLVMLEVETRSPSCASQCWSVERFIAVLLEWQFEFEMDLAAFFSPNSIIRCILGNLWRKIAKGNRQKYKERIWVKGLLNLWKWYLISKWIVISVNMTWLHFKHKFLINYYTFKSIIVKSIWLCFYLNPWLNWSHWNSKKIMINDIFHPMSRRNNPALSLCFKQMNTPPHEDDID